MKIYGEIYDSEQLISEINALESDSVLEINSPGGDVYEGLNIVNAIQNCPYKITAKINVLAASMAGVIALACDSVQITKNDAMMLHNCWTFAAGNKEELSDRLKELEVIDTILHNIIAEHCADKSIGDVINEGDYWLTGEQAAETFDHVELVEAPAKADKIAAYGSLCELISKVQLQGSAEPQQQEYIISDRLKALLDEELE